MRQLETIRETGSYPRFAPIIGVVSADTPDEAEATRRALPPSEWREVMQYTAEETTLGEIIKCAQALENAGLEPRVKFSRVHEDEGPLWGFTILVRT
jgi:hypothetical protein